MSCLSERGRRHKASQNFNTLENFTTEVERYFGKLHYRLASYDTWIRL